MDSAYALKHIDHYFTFSNMQTHTHTHSWQHENVSCTFNYSTVRKPWLLGCMYIHVKIVIKIVVAIICEAACHSMNEVGSNVIVIIYNCVQKQQGSS